MVSFKIKAVKVTCKNCGNKALSDEFRLDYARGMMVCSGCSRKSNKEKTSEIIKKDNISKKPLDWDETDDYLERLYKRRINVEGVTYERIEGSKYHIKYLCKKCNFTFKYNTLKHWPNRCPSCAKDIEMVSLVI